MSVQHKIINCIMRSNYDNIPVHPEDDITCQGNWVQLHHSNGKTLFPGKVLYRCTIPDTSQGDLKIQNAVLSYYLSCNKKRAYPAIGDIVFENLGSPINKPS